VASADAARAVAEEAARASYGKLLAILAARTNNIAAAEDALADAFAAALQSWPETSAPDAPEAWLLTTARRKLIDAARRDQTRDKAAPELQRAIDEVQDTMINAAAFPDERMKLLFICAHPAIDKNIRTPLMLQTVLGLDAQRIAKAFLAAPATMGQRLVRAKRKIIEAKIRFDDPDPAQLDERLNDITDAIYAAYGVGYDGETQDGAAAHDLSEEAIYLANLVTGLAPEYAEGHGLFALMLYSHARCSARQKDGIYVPLSDQETALWDKELLETAERALFRASHMREPGRYQIEAAIQSAHVAARLKGIDTSLDILKLYDQLIMLAPTTGAKVAKAAALAQVSRAEEALALLDEISDAHTKLYQPYWAVRAHALQASGDTEGADNAYNKAISLSNDPAVRRYLIEKRAKEASPPLLP